MRETCSHCLTSRTRDKLIEVQPGVWFCRSWEECLEFWSRLPNWLHV